MPHTPENSPGGEWVPAEKVHPTTNVADRAYRLSDGTEGVAHQFPLSVNDGSTAAVTHWYFAKPSN